MGNGGVRAARLAAAVSLLVVASFVAACTTETPSSTSTTQAPTTSPPGGGDEKAVVEVPVELTEHDGSPRATTRIKIGGKEVEVIIDSGSAGIMLDSSAVPDLELDGTTNEITVAGGNITLAHATTTVGFRKATSNPVTVGVIQQHTCNEGQECDPDADISDMLSGTQGVLGIALSNYGITPESLINPLLKMPAPYGVGYELDLTGSKHFVLRIGAVSAGPTSVTVPFEPQDPPTYADGTPAYDKDMTLCWKIGTAEGCGLTDIDSGSPAAALATDALPGLPSSGTLPSGTDVTITPGPSASGPTGALWQFKTGVIAGIDQVEVMPTLPPPTQFNTGLGFFQNNVLGYDLAQERYVITPA